VISFLHFTYVVPGFLLGELNEKYNKDYKNILLEALVAYKNLRELEDSGHKILVEKEDWLVDNEANFIVEKTYNQVHFE